MDNEMILCFGYAQNWDYWRQDHDIMLRLAKKNKVVYVEKQLGYSNYKLMKKSMWKDIFGGGNPRWVNENFIIVSSPPRLPYDIAFASAKAKSILLHKAIIISKGFLERKVKKILTSLKFKPTVTWFFEPFDLLLAGRFGERISCYRVFDEMSLFRGPEFLKKIIENIEKKYIKKVDFVFASSYSQYEKRKTIHSKTFLIPNAGDFNHYNRALTEELSMPQDIKGIRPPIIGFIGKVNYKMDVELVTQLSKKYPDRSIVLIGPTEKDVMESILKKANKNTFFLGYKNIDELPNYIKYIDVSIIPYKVNSLTQTMYPVKLHEHLAAGKPIVCTDLPEVRPFEDVVRIAKTNEEFLRSVEEELLANSEEKIKTRVEVAKENSWENRIADIEQIIKEHPLMH